MRITILAAISASLFMAGSLSATEIIYYPPSAYGPPVNHKNAIVYQAPQTHHHHGGFFKWFHGCNSCGKHGGLGTGRSGGFRRSNKKPWIHHQYPVYGPNPYIRSPRDFFMYER